MGHLIFLPCRRFRRWTFCVPFWIAFASWPWVRRCRTFCAVEVSVLLVELGFSSVAADFLTCRSAGRHVDGWWRLVGGGVVSGTILYVSKYINNILVCTFLSERGQGGIPSPSFNVGISCIQNHRKTAVGILRRASSLQSP